MNKQKGFILWIVVIIIALGLLKYFLNWDIFDAAASDQGQSTIGYIRNILNTVWSYIAEPALFVWHKIFWPILSLAWNNLQILIQKGQGVDIPAPSI